MKVWFPAIRTGSGAEVFTRQLAEGLQRYEVKTVITWFRHGFEFVPDLLRHIKPPCGTDVVHANSWTGFAFQRMGIPLVVTAHHCVHDPSYAPYRNIFQAVYHSVVIRPYEKRSFAAASVVTAVSDFTSKQVTARFPSTTPVVIYNGIDTEFFRPAGDIRTNPDRPFRLLFVGNLTWRKGFDAALAIMRQLDVQRFELYHTTGLRGETVANRTGIHCLGRLDRAQLLHAYQDCDALLFPSRYEGFGYAIGEAMACGKPVIAADQGPAREIIVDKVTGILCPVDDIAAFVRAIQYLAANREQVLRIGEAGRQRICDNFTQNRMIAGYSRLYHSLLR